jgi:hypothetical protein
MNSPGWPKSFGSLGGGSGGLPLRPSGFCVAKKRGCVTSMSLWHTLRSPVHISGFKVPSGNVGRGALFDESICPMNAVNKGTRQSNCPYRCIKRSSPSTSASHRRRLAKDSGLHPLFCAYVFRSTKCSNSITSTLPSSCCALAAKDPTRLRDTDRTAKSFLTNTAVPARLMSAHA